MKQDATKEQTGITNTHKSISKQKGRNRSRSEIEINKSALDKTIDVHCSAKYVLKDF